MPAKGGPGEPTLGICAWPVVGLRCCGRCERVSCASRGPQQPHLQHGAAVSANDATGLRFSYLSAFARGSPVDTHDVRRPCPCGTRLRPEHVLGRDCHRLTHGHNRGVTRPGMLSQSLRPYRKRLVSSLTALGLLTKTRIKKCRRLPPITLRHPIRLLSTLGQTQLIKVPLKHGDDAGGPGRSHRILSFGCPPLLVSSTVGSSLFTQARVYTAQSHF